MPHGFCFLWNPIILVLFVASDAAIAVAYFAIAWCLENSRTHFASETLDSFLPSWALGAFRTFIFACACTHVLDIVVLWIPVYWLQATTKVLTAAASVSTAFLCVSLVIEAHKMRKQKDAAAIQLAVYRKPS